MILERGESKNVHKSIFLENSESRHLCIMQHSQLTQVCVHVRVHASVCVCVCCIVCPTHLKEILDTRLLFHPLQCVLSNNKVSTIVSIR